MTAIGFTRMDKMTAEQWELANKSYQELANGLVDWNCKALLELRGKYLGSQVDGMEHCLQTATRAFRDGADCETVVCALLHDIGDCGAPYNHGQLAAAILRPYVSPENAWMIEKHEIFQGYYYHQFMGRDPNERDRFKGHPAYQRTVIFCDRWDQVSFDPNYDSMSLSDFRPMLDLVLSRQPRLEFKQQ